MSQRKVDIVALTCALFNETNLRTVAEYFFNFYRVDLMFSSELVSDGSEPDNGFDLPSAPRRLSLEKTSVLWPSHLGNEREGLVTSRLT